MNEQPRIRYEESGGIHERTEGFDGGYGSAEQDIKNHHQQESHRKTYRSHI